MVSLEVLAFVAIFVCFSIAAPTEEAPVAGASNSGVKAPLALQNSTTKVPGEYIVIFDTNVNEEEVSSHMVDVRNYMSNFSNETNRILGEYHIGSFRGYGAKMNDRVLDFVRMMEHVACVEVSQKYNTTKCHCKSQKNAPWGIVRTTHRMKPNSNIYKYDPKDGTNVDVYIIDTGIEISHDDFGGRAKWGVDCTDKNDGLRTDLNGHGTHVAGIAISNTFGLARRATAIAVRVLDENGGGYTSDVLCGIDWIVKNSNRKRRSIANMSLGGKKSMAINKATNNAVTAHGISMVVAAGNDDSDACNYSPASAELAITVASSDMGDTIASTSNYGRCVDIIAPGVDIMSTWINNSYREKSGTSMASPHVAGVMAKYLTKHNLNPAALKAKIIEDATPNKIKMIGKPGTPNKLIFKDCGWH